MMERNDASLSARWLRLALCTALLLGFAFLLSRGYAPPGAAGEVIRNNLKYEINASPMFYTEVEDSLAFGYAELFLE